MSTAHRPTYVPAQGKQTVGNSRQYSSRDMAGQTKLKFRQPGQGTTGELSRRDLKAELERAERKHANPHAPEEVDDEHAAKRRKLLEDSKDLDKDDEPETPKAPAAVEENGNAGAASPDADDDDDDEDSDDDEDETAELMRELEKIKRERAEEKERQEREQASATALDREAEVAMGNPLLNLQAAITGNATPSAASTTASSGFSVKRRWDDDVIFKNQAVSEKPRKEFVNDLLRTEFHKRFLKRFIA